MNPMVESYMATLIVAAAALWILHFFHTTTYIRTACKVLMSWTVAVFWTVLLLYSLAQVPVIFAALTLLELLLVVAIIAILVVLIWQAAGPSIKSAMRARRVLNALGNVLTLLGITGNPQRPADALTGLRDFFTANGWNGVPADKLSEVAKAFNELIDGDPDGFTATGIYDWLTKQGQGEVAGPMLDALIERINTVLAEDDLTDEQRRQLERFWERLDKVRQAREAAKAAAGD